MRNNVWLHGMFYKLAYILLQILQRVPKNLRCISFRPPLIDAHQTILDSLDTEIDTMDATQCNQSDVISYLFVQNFYEYLTFVIIYLFDNTFWESEQVTIESLYDYVRWNKRHYQSYN